MPSRSREDRRRLERMRRSSAGQQLIVPTQQGGLKKSLLDSLQDGNEYQSIVDIQLEAGLNLLDDVVRGLEAIAQLRGRPCLMYCGNVVKKDQGGGAVDSSDDLPFREMVAKVPLNIEEVDVFISTNGGSAHQVNNFVNCLRDRFKKVDFLIPSFCMSAGTLFAVSGDRIWMTERACLGPTDPQVPTEGGRYVPAQALLLLVSEIQNIGQKALDAGQPIPWAYVRVIDTLDKKELGEAMTASQYSLTMASQFLEQYKLRNWLTHENGNPVTPQERHNTATAIAGQLVSHERWKSHGHALSRDVLWNEVKLQIDHPDEALRRAMVRLWAVVVWIFDKSPMVKLLCSAQYRYARNEQLQILATRNPSV